MSFVFTKKVFVGSLWRIKNDLSAYYLFEKVEDLEWGDFCPPIEFEDLKEENALMVIEHKTINNRHYFCLLGNCKIYKDLNIPAGTWDNVFVPL